MSEAMCEPDASRRGERTPGCGLRINGGNNDGASQQLSPVCILSRVVHTHKPIFRPLPPTSYLSYTMGRPTVGEWAAHKRMNPLVWLWFVFRSTWFFFVVDSPPVWMLGLRGNVNQFDDVEGKFSVPRRLETAEGLTCLCTLRRPLLHSGRPHTPGRRGPGRVGNYGVP